MSTITVLFSSFIIESVFDLVPSKDKEKMIRIRKEGTPSTVPPVTEQSLATDNSTQQSYKHPPGPTPPEQQLVPVQLDSIRQSHDMSVGPTTQRTDTPVFSGGSLSFKPFAKNDRKQARYEKYLSLIKQGNKGNFLLYDGVKGLSIKNTIYKIRTLIA